jgi:hypothetical protein
MSLNTCPLLEWFIFDNHEILETFVGLQVAGLAACITSLGKAVCVCLPCWAEWSKLDSRLDMAGVKILFDVA